VKAALFKNWNDLGPTSAVSEGPVNQNDILHGSLLRVSTCGPGEGGGGSDASGKNSLGDFHFSILLIDRLRLSINGGC
jgi:hypothetical protein